MRIAPQEYAPRHIAVIGNALPRQCGLATYTTHSVAALRAACPGLTVDHYAMDDGQDVEYGTDVHRLIRAGDVTDYVAAGREIERSKAQAIWVQHEFGIFGGPAGAYLLQLLRQTTKPLLVTLHTVLERPDADQRRVMDALNERAAHFVVMAHHAAEILARVYGVEEARITMIPHGAPDRALVPTADVKQALGLPPGPTVLTFGLLSPGKGIEYAIRAMPAVLKSHPDLIYIIAGATHPALRREQGEAYRESLIALAEDMGVADNIRFLNRFLDDDELIDRLQACDVYLTPYLNRDQVTSGTLAYALAMGRPVVSTPYIHATEALSDGMGELVPFRDAEAIAEALKSLFDDAEGLARRASATWERARRTIWPNNARAILDLLAGIVRSTPIRLDRHRPAMPRISGDAMLDGVRAMTDDVGILQHGIYGIADRVHGYCIDDNARALMLVSQMREGDPAVRARLAAVYAAFVQHAWSSERGAFRNFMGYNRDWLEERGSEDSNGRTLWALGVVQRDAEDPMLRRWARALFDQALPLAHQLTAPRAIAFVTLGLAARADAGQADEGAREMLAAHGATFENLLSRNRRPDWPWFEAMLSYDNARLPQALIEVARITGNRQALKDALETLEWIAGIQTSSDGHFRAVGTESFGRPYADPQPFDQQPLEAAAMIDACASAWRATGNPEWLRRAHVALAWFTGDNDLGVPLADARTGKCFDGLTPEGVNLNQGAESILALQQALVAIRALPDEAQKSLQIAAA
ncbi:MAG: glycosyltransferase [Sphingomonas bacterium]